MTTGVSPRGERMLHLLNPTGYPATVQVDVGDPTGLLDRPLLLPARTGGCSGSGSSCPAAARSSRATPRSPSWASDRIGVRTRASGERTEVWLRTDRHVRAPR